MVNLRSSPLACGHRSHPNEGTAGLFTLRLLSVLLVLGAIVRKNIGKN